MVYVICLCGLSRYHSPVVYNGICYMFVSVVSVSQPSSREWYMLYVYVLSRYSSPGVENGICYMFVCVVSLSQPSSREWYMLFVCVCCLVISDQ